ncbi:hypothetical protein LEP1GSC026_1544 [Leptospira interrogans str. 2002000623]|uniref:Uncharacterized protein n=1 Tax=Leptospira interrogans serovar Lora str. TE 1992 TaxID=1193028 RepID=M3E0R9_LEPIR|nr:hypothetical protein LEP1GSC007_1692 [Leptospira interrogans serovar Bulgarica str. Mallika]EKQ36056.1 hypothetical protein LEP1GSC025_0526 [Leptospira interrogans str. 2002000621]EKQ50024.1 hypothetical protein LEP1GSC026_1544 [Leptospira interrogans str. 2002000623]EMF40645.1 hypothetical protein LEP1GSC067_3147 [Leptospira interrogans serovar Lora str. TE 1992]
MAPWLVSYANAVIGCALFAEIWKVPPHVLWLAWEFICISVISRSELRSTAQSKESTAYLAFRTSGRAFRRQSSVPRVRSGKVRISSMQPGRPASNTSSSRPVVGSRWLRSLRSIRASSRSNNTLVRSGYLLLSCGQYSSWRISTTRRGACLSHCRAADSICRSTRTLG